jgi:predicted acyltransferase
MTGSAIDGVAGTVAPSAHSRHLALDVFRGFTVAGMLVVNTPGTWSAVYAPLRHAAWHGWTFADLIFPFFLFIVGITTYISTSAARARGEDDAVLVRRILRRGAIIILIGLLISSFPWWPLERIAQMRIPGVLQRIGITYVVAALITLRGTVRTHAVAAATILLGYWIVSVAVPVPGQPLTPAGVARLEPAEATLAAWLDRLLLDGHLWAVTRTWDPEGVLSTIPAVASVILGSMVAGVVYANQPLGRRITWMVSVGAGATAAGLVWGMVFPINKNLWTSSYVLFTAGLATIALALCMWLIEARRQTWWTAPFVIFGLNPLVAFAGSGLMARCIYSLIRVQYEGAAVPLQSAVYQWGFASWLAPKNASLLFALCFTGLWLGLLLLLRWRNIVIKV